MKNYCHSNSSFLVQDKVALCLFLFYQILPFVFLICISLSLFIIADKRMEQPFFVDNLKRNTGEELSHASLAQASLSKISTELEYYSSQ